MRLIVATAVLAISVSSALADRQVTEDERAKLTAAIQTAGCTGGKLEMDEDDEQFEVDGATCADGKKYELKFDMQLRLLSKKLD
jgi:hypothetical protein